LGRVRNGTRYLQGRDSQPKRGNWPLDDYASLHVLPHGWLLMAYVWPRAAPPYSRILASNDERSPYVRLWCTQGLGCSSAEEGGCALRKLVMVRGRHRPRPPLANAEAHHDCSVLRGDVGPLPVVTDGHEVIAAVELDLAPPYAATAYVALLADAGIAISMADVGAAWQNRDAERLIYTIKEAEVHLSDYQDFHGVYQQIGRFLTDVYNCKRIAFSLGLSHSI
jgi:hypothetical protein